ncbi:MAG TPA: isocitrate lyase/PEP mutase family protein [Bryobacteraceae bacterium]|nr:isocitrate lyase/PEP mutase family protein [Bryobacteraceae bacterium]
MSAAFQFRELLRRDHLVSAPGAYDCITAKMIEQAGFRAIYMTGAGTAAMLGYPDYGLATMSEMAENAGRIAGAVSVPVIADADTGYGNELNVVRTVREFEQRGVAGIHIEDQAFPKKCGHLDNKTVIPLEDFLAKIRAAASARRDPDFLVIARTDSRATLGLKEAVHRANAALDAGAGMAFVEAPESLEEVAAIPRLVHGPCLLNIVWRGKTPEVSLDEARDMGYRLAILPALLFPAVIGICDTMLHQLRSTGRHPVPPGDISVKEGFRRVGAEEWDKLRDQFRVTVP